jgi:hypothetical protein
MNGDYMLKLNIGASKKVGEQNYGSRGASVNLEIELDTGLLTEPAKLQEKIRQLFGVARQSLAEELNGNGNGNGHGQPASNGTSKAAPPGNGNGNNGAPRTPSPRKATQSQVKAIHAIARNLRIDVSQFLKDRFRVAKPDDLTIKEASETIDSLKAEQEQGGG